MSTEVIKPMKNQDADEQSFLTEILLTYDSDTQSVRASIKPTQMVNELNIEMLQSYLKLKGYGDFFECSSAMHEFISLVNEGQGGAKVIACRRDAELIWKMQPDKMAVYLTTKASFGGRKITYEWLMDELTTRKIDKTCIEHDLFDFVINSSEVKDVCIAKGTAPVAGLDSQFEVLVEDSRSLLQSYSAEEQVDFHKVQDFIVVEKGTVLMRRLPPTEGKSGLNVLGESLPNKPGSHIEFNVSGEGSIIDPDNPDQLIADVKGHPIIINNGIKVDPTLRVEVIDLVSGNIDFDGSVEVNGDVTSGFSLHATGDVVIRGMVERAVVTAGRNLTIAGGVAGEDLGRDKNNQPILKARIKAGGDIKVKYVNLAYLHCQGDIFINEYVLQSHLISKGGIYLTQPGSKGCIIGGKILAQTEVIANTIGSVANVPTVIRVGRVNCKRKLEDQLKAEHENCLKNCENLKKLLKSTHDSNQDSLKKDALIIKITSTLQFYEQKIARILLLLQRLDIHKQASYKAELKIKEAVFPNVYIGIDGAIVNNRDRKGACTMVREGSDVVSR